MSIKFQENLKNFNIMILKFLEIQVWANSVDTDQTAPEGVV